MNKLICFTAATVLFAIVTAYDFSDSVYNQVLANDLQELHEYFDELHYNIRHRSRRDEEAVIVDKCRRKKPLCCAEEVFEGLHDKDRELKRECFKQVTGRDREPWGFDPFKCEKIEKHKKEITCVMQCVGQKKNVLDESGNPKVKEFTNLVKEIMANETWFGEIQDKVIDTCLGETKKAAENKDTIDSSSCNPAGIKLVHCLFREIQVGCPSEQIKDQKACSRARDKIKRHNDLFSPQPFMNDE